jgi:hypothetical protein
MSITAAVEQALEPTYCKLGRILADLPAEDFDAINNGLSNGLTPAAVARILTDNGHPVSEKVAQRHARSICACKDAA